ncbi:MAG: DDE-type integrase/transposase/recombinase [Moraxellaceae bacterium]|nr:DDE-type integrase/transposase/recombinase [Moraxellaceae bacterium]
MKNESYYQDLKNRLEQLPFGKRSDLVKSASNFLGVTPKTIYANLKKLGYSKDRKARSDKGDSQITREELEIIASLIRQSHRANNKQLMSVKLAIDVAYNKGKIKELYHEGTIARLLRENQLSSKQMRQATPHVKLKTSHPNQRWQLDPSICVLYYLKKNKGLAVMDKDKFYKNKPKNFEKIANERVFRYVVTDHCTGAFYCKYYLISGEDRETLFDFLVTAMSEKDRAKNPFEGVPFGLDWDLGTANQSPMIKKFLELLDVKHTAHAKGNSRAKGQVERTNDIIERNFESLLHLEKYAIHSIEELNYYCEQWQRYFQSSQRYAHTRHGMPRFTAWRKITKEQLRLCPPVKVCQMLLQDKDSERVVKGDYNISFDGKKYNLSGVDNIAIGAKVAVCVNPYAYPNIRVSHANRFGEMISYDIAPLTQDEWGFDSDAKDKDACEDGHYYQAKLTQADLNRQKLDEIAYGTTDQAEIDKIRNKKTKQAFNGEMAFLSHIAEENEKNNVLNMPKQGKPLDVGEPALQKIRPTKRPSLETVKRDEPILPVLDFIKWFVKQHGIIDGMNDIIRAKYSEGVKESDYQTIAETLLNPTPTATITQLKKVV